MNQTLTALLLFLCCVSCHTNSAQISTSLDVTEYKNQIYSNDSIQLVDVRTADEFKMGHLPNAVNIDYNSDNFDTKIMALDTARPVYLYCQSGGRSTSAQDVLSKKGFREVYNMKGGIIEWKANDFSIESLNPKAVNGWIGMSMAEYEILTQSEVPVLFDFKATWCGPCKQLAPILRSIEQEYNGKIKVMEIDVDEHKSLADELKIRSIPFLIFYKNGKRSMNIEGLTDKKNLVKSLGLKR